MIRGEKIELRAVNPKAHGVQLLEWRNTPELRRWFREYREITWDEHVNYWHSRTGKRDETHFVVTASFPIEQGPAKGVPKSTIIGYAGFTKIHPVNRTAEFGIYLAPEYQGKGFGKDALLTLLRYGFHELNLNHIWAEVYDDNAALEVYKHVGFMVEGEMRNHVFKHGYYLSAHIVGMLYREWEQIHG